MAIKKLEGNMQGNRYQVGIVAAKWNRFVTDQLLEGALDVFKNKGYTDDQIIVARCPGAYEIPATTQALLAKVDGVVAIGAVIRGETPHFDYVCRTANRGVLQLNLEHNKPITFGVLTTDTVQQATERADSESDFGNKGAEAALALIEMLSLIEKIEKE